MLTPLLIPAHLHCTVIKGSSQSIKIGKSDLIDIDCIDQSVEIDDTLVSFIDRHRARTLN